MGSVGRDGRRRCSTSFQSNRARNSLTFDEVSWLTALINYDAGTNDGIDGRNCSYRDDSCGKRSLGNNTVRRRDSVTWFELGLEVTNVEPVKVVELKRNVPQSCETEAVCCVRSR